MSGPSQAFSEYHARTVRKNAVANGWPLGALLGGEHQRLGDGGAQNVRGVGCVLVVDVMQMGAVQVLAMENVQVEAMQMGLMVERVLMVQMVHVRGGEKVAVFQGFDEQ